MGPSPYPPLKEPANLLVCPLLMLPMAKMLEDFVQSNGAFLDQFFCFIECELIYYSTFSSALGWVHLHSVILCSVI